MDNTTTVKMDNSGRMVIPKTIRKKFPNNRFEISIEQGMIILKSVPPLRSLLGIIPDLNMKEIYDEHEEEVIQEG